MARVGLSTSISWFGLGWGVDTVNLLRTGEAPIPEALEGLARLPRQITRLRGDNAASLS